MSVSFTVPGSDVYPPEMFFARRGAMGGPLARAWVALDQDEITYVVSGQVNGSRADPTDYVPSLAGATHGYANLGSSPLSAAATATIIAAAFTSLGVTGVSTDGAQITVVGASNLVIPPTVDMTDTSLRGMWGIQRDDWGDGGAGQTLNQNGGTDAVVWMNLGTLAAAGRVVGAYAWCNTNAAQCVMRLVVGTGPAYSLSPGPITVIGEAEATSDPVTGFASIAFPAVAVGASTQIWIGHATDTPTAGLRFRSQAATPLGAGDVPPSQNILVDLTRNASSTNAFGASVTPTVDQNFAINSALGIIFEVPDGSGNYPADGSLTLRIGDQNPDPDHGTQFDAGPGIIDDETTHHRQGVLPLTGIGIVSVTRVIGDTAAGEDCRAFSYEWPDLDFPSSTPATLISDFGPMGFTAGTGNRAFTNTLPARVEIGTEAITGPWWSLGFNYCTASGAPIATMTLPVFLDDATGDSGWLDCWVDDRETWHDDIRGASEYAQPAGVTEYRTRVSTGNNGMPTADIDTPAPVTFATDESDDSPSAIAADWVIVVRVGFAEVEVSSYPIAGDVTVEGAWSMAASAVNPIAGDASAGGAWAMAASAVHPLAGDASVAGAWSMAAGAVHPIGGDVTVAGSWSMAAMAVPDLDDVVGGAGSDLELQVMGVDQYGVLRPRAGDSRPVRFELLDASGSAIDHDIIESLTVQVRRASGEPGSYSTLTPTAETEGEGDVTYTWAVDLSEVVTVGGRWILEVDVVLVDGRTATWPSAGPLVVHAVEPVG